MRFQLSIKCDGEAFAPDPSREVAAILQRVFTPLNAGQTEGILLDSNGNGVGTWSFTEADEDHQPTKVVDNDGDVWRRDADGRWWCGVDDSIDVNDPDDLGAWAWLSVANLAVLQEQFGVREVLS